MTVAVVSGESLRRPQTAARDSPMKMLPAFSAFALVCACSQAFAGMPVPSGAGPADGFNPQQFELAFESGYLFGVINPPRNYEIGALFVTGRVRWGVVRSDSWIRGYQQFYVSAIAEPIFRGIENHYFGLNFGGRYNFVQPGRRLNPYISGGLGLGWIDSHPNIPGGQGQDFTFNILTAAGVSYSVNESWKIDIGVLYQHLSNGGQTDPNPSLNLIGPRIGVTYSF